MCFKMFKYKSVINIFIFVNIFLKIHALFEQGIIGGLPGMKANFTYQAAIIGTNTLTSKVALLGAGAIIGNNFLLSAAHCFTNSSGHLLELLFSARLGSINLKIKGGLLVEIIRIYFIDYDHVTLKNDLAVIQIPYSSNADISLFLSKLEIPAPEESFETQTCRVSGYGYTWIKADSILSSGFIGGTDSKLRYADVLVLFDVVCKDLLEELIDTDSQICGVTRYPELSINGGVCKLDDGNPLVCNGKIVGILSRPEPGCDDSTASSIYTKVSFYSEIIRRIIEGNPDANLTIYENRQYFV